MVELRILGRGGSISLRLAFTGVDTRQTRWSLKELEESEDESDDEEMYWWDCPYCKMIFDSEKSRKKHMMKCM